jgi:hypothetical protein
LVRRFLLKQREEEGDNCFCFLCNNTPTKKDDGSNLLLSSYQVSFQVEKKRKKVTISS